MSVQCLLYTDQGKSVFLKTGKSVYPISWEMLDAGGWVCSDDRLMLNLCVLIFVEDDYISVHFISPFKHLCSCVMIN